MAYSFNANSARRKAFDDEAVQDEINYITGKIIEAVGKGKRKLVVDGNTRMTGRSVRADFSGIATMGSATAISIASNACTVTASGHGLKIGDHVMITGASATGGDAEIAKLNDRIFAIASATDGGFGVAVTAGDVTGSGTFFKVPVKIVEDTDAKEYRKVWKGDNIVDDYENSALTRHMDAVIRHFRDRGYTILRKDNGGSGRVTGVADDRAATFQWEITW